MSYMGPHISGTHDAFSWSKILVGTWYKHLYRHYFPVPPFAEDFSCERPLCDHKSYLFFSHKSSNWHFLAWHKPPLSQCSTAQERNPLGISKLVNKGYCCLSDDSFWTTSQALFALDHVPAGSLHFVPFDSADLPHYKILCSGFLNVPLPFGTLLEVSPKGHHTFDQL
jgi:hypothetical protein